MTPEQIAIVQQTWEKVAGISKQAAEIFYARLFELDPSLKELFNSDMEEQGKKLMQMIATAVAHLDRLGEVVPAVEALGKRHVDYGVKDEQYETVGAALIYTLDKGLGDDFTPAAKEAWTEVYTVLAGTMKTAANAG